MPLQAGSHVPVAARLLNNELSLASVTVSITWEAREQVLRQGWPCRHPDELYKGGLQRELFLPFIARLKGETEVHDMASPVDYRKLAQHRNGIYFTPAAGPDPNQRLAAHFEDLVATAGGRPPSPQMVAVQMGRTLRVPLAGAPFISPPDMQKEDAAAIGRLYARRWNMKACILTHVLPAFSWKINDRRSHSPSMSSEDMRMDTIPVL